MKRTLALLSLILLLGGCATRMSVSDPFLTVVWGDAYTLECQEGQAMLVDGEYICPNGDSIEVRGGHIGESFKGLVESAFKLVGGLLPRGTAPE